MSIFKRTVSSLFYKVDQVIGEIENHDALVQVAIREQQQKLATAKVECQRIRKQSAALKTQIAELKEKAVRWEQRAVNEAAENEERALACMQQLDRVTSEVTRLTEMATQYDTAIAKMSDEIKRGETSLQDLKQKHQFMRARQVTSDALGRFGNVGETQQENIDTAFDRWEVKISQGEFATSVDAFDTEADDLERTYVEDEKKEALKAQLSALVAERNEKES